MLYFDILHGLPRDIACANEVLIHDTWDHKLSDQGSKHSSNSPYEFGKYLFSILSIPVYTSSFHVVMGTGLVNEFVTILIDKKWYIFYIGFQE
jgi:hypothetical protein